MKYDESHLYISWEEKIYLEFHSENSTGGEIFLHDVQNDGGPIAAVSLGLFGPRLGGQVRGGPCRRRLAREACVLRKRGLIPSLHVLCPVCFFSARGRTTVPET